MIVKPRTILRLAEEIKSGLERKILFEFSGQLNQEYIHIIDKLKLVIDEILNSPDLMIEVSNSNLTKLEKNLRQVLEAGQIHSKEKMILINESLFLIQDLIDIFNEIKLLNFSTYGKKILDAANDIKNKAIEDAELIHKKRVEAEKDLSIKTNVELVNSFNSLRESAEYKSYIWLAITFLTFCFGAKLILLPVWNNLINLLGNELSFSKASFLSILLRIPTLAIFVYVYITFLNFYKKYETIALSYKHKASIAGSMPLYSNYLFGEVLSVTEQKRDELKSEIIKFEIRTLDEVFRLPALSEKSSQLEMSLNKNGVSAKVGESQV